MLTSALVRAALILATQVPSTTPSTTTPARPSGAPATQPGSTLPTTPPTGTANPGVMSPRPAARPARVVSPEVAPDRRVTFRLRAPQARQVQVRDLFFADRVDMTRDAQGLWSATVGPVDPGLYEYNFSVDGLRMIDPANSAIQPAIEPEVSILEVRGDPPLVTELRDVPHGTVHVHHYRARTLQGRDRRVHVYTPPGYEQGKGKLPVLFLLHGSGDNDATWTEYGRATFIIDNLLADKKAVPMIVVMPDGHAVPRGAQPADRDNTVAFMDDLLADVMPLVQKQYRARTDGAGRAIAGLSMGGRQALTVGLDHPDMFAWVAAMSAAVPPIETLADGLARPDDLNKKLRWLWIACGTEDRLFAPNQQLVDQLASKSIRHQWHPGPGAHRWPLWRGYLAEIAPQLFKPPGR